MIRTLHRSAFCLALLGQVALAQDESQAGDAGEEATEPAGNGSFFDDFDRFSSQRWTVSDGWSNGEHQNCVWSEQNVVRAAGNLRVTFRPEPYGDRDYSCGEVQTTALYGYGTFEARLKTPRGTGLNAAFFTYVGPQQDSPHDEIDFEILLRDPGSVDVGAYISGAARHGHTSLLPADADADFHTYAIVWEPNQIRWYVDGTLLRRAVGQVPSHPQKMMFSLWGSDTLVDWMGSFIPPRRPIHMDIDWAAYTALGEDCQFEGSILCTIGR